MLTKAEKGWRAQYQTYDQSQWPMADELQKVATLLRKSTVSKLLGKLTGDGNLISDMAQKLGYREGVVPKAADLEALAVHERDSEAFLSDVENQRAVGAQWNGFATPFEKMSEALALSTRARTVLKEQPYGSEVEQKAFSLPNDDLVALAAKFSAAPEQFAKLPKAGHGLLDSTPITSLIANLRSRSDAAFKLIAAFAVDALKESLLPVEVLDQAVTAEFARRAAEANYAVAPLAKSHDELVSNAQAMAAAESALTWVASARKYVRSEETLAKCLSADAQKFVHVSSICDWSSISVTLRYRKLLRRSHPNKTFADSIWKVLDPSLS